KIDAIVERGMDGGVYTAAAVAVARHGRLVKLRGYGSAGGRSVDPSTTLFDLASLTKVVGTTAAVMALVDDGTVKLDEPVYRYVSGRVFVPLGMRNTMYDPPLVWWNRTVPSALRSERPYVLRDVVHDGNSFRLGGVAGHAGLFSTAGDLAIFAQTLLNLGAYG